MKVGSLVETLSNFEESRMRWGFPYPNKGDILTVASVVPHHNQHCRKLGIVLLTFEEIPGLVPVCDKRINGDVNFVELLPPMNIEEIIKNLSYESQEKNIPIPA